MPPPPKPAEHVERALCVLAHPDDVDFGSGGTVARMTAAGTEVTYCIVTDGDAGGFDETPREQMPALRRAEQQAAAAEVGVTDVRFLGYPDGRLELTLDLRRDISRVIRQVRPQRILTSSPERWWERVAASHPDHMTVGEATLRAVYPDARNPFAFPELLEEEGLEAWTVSEVWLGRQPAGRPRRRRHRDRRAEVRRPEVPRHAGEPPPRHRGLRERLDADDGDSASACRRATWPRPSTWCTRRDLSSSGRHRGHVPSPRWRRAAASRLRGPLRGPLGATGPSTSPAARRRGRGRTVRTDGRTPDERMGGRGAVGGLAATGRRGAGVRRLAAEVVPAVRAGGSSPPSGSARCGWTAAACAARSRRATPRSSPR